MITGGVDEVAHSMMLAIETKQSVVDDDGWAYYGGASSRGLARQTSKHSIQPTKGEVDGRGGHQDDAHDGGAGSKYLVATIVYSTTRSHHHRPIEPTSGEAGHYWPK